jgi:hypothetical protein
MLEIKFTMDKMTIVLSLFEGLIIVSGVGAGDQLRPGSIGWF